MKFDDTNVVPEVLTAPWLKRFFKVKLGIPVRVENAGSQGWVTVWIQSDRSSRELRYLHQFPAELGQRCMAIVYDGHTGLSQQAWGGNIGAHSLAMYGPQWKLLLNGLINSPLIQTLELILR